MRSGCWASGCRQPRPSRSVGGGQLHMPCCCPACSRTGSAHAALWFLTNAHNRHPSFPQQMGGTTYYNPYGPPPAVPSMAGMPAFGPAPPPGLSPPFGMPAPWAQPAVPAMQQMAAAAMMPALVRQGSVSEASPPGP